MNILTVVAELVQLGLAIEPAIQDAVNEVMALSGSGNPPTTDQQAAIDAGLEAAHTALQAAKAG